jgi:hypothetical protein
MYRTSTIQPEQATNDHRYEWLVKGGIKPVFMAIASVQVVVCVSTVALCKFPDVVDAEGLNARGEREREREREREKGLTDLQQISSARRTAPFLPDTTFWKN